MTTQSRHAKRENGLCAVRVDWPDSNVHVLVDGITSDDQDEVDRVAAMVSDTATLENAYTLMAERCSRFLNEKTAIEDKLNVILGLRSPRTFGEIAARERDGKIWLGRPDDDWTYHFAYTFPDWIALRRAWPELAPCGLKIDAEGLPVVLMRAIVLGETSC
jgi:hypothetical protein